MKTEGANHWSSFNAVANYWYGKLMASSIFDTCTSASKVTAEKNTMVDGWKNRLAHKATRQT